MAVGTNCCSDADWNRKEHDHVPFSSSVEVSFKCTLLEKSSRVSAGKAEVCAEFYPWYHKGRAEKSRGGAERQELNWLSPPL